MVGEGGRAPGPTSEKLDPSPGGCGRRKCHAAGGQDHLQGVGVLGPGCTSGFEKRLDCRNTLHPPFPPPVYPIPPGKSFQRWESRHGDLRRSCPVMSLPAEGDPEADGVEAGGNQAEAVSGPGSREMESGARPSWPVALVVGGGEPGIQASSQGRQRRGHRRREPRSPACLATTMCSPGLCAAGGEPRAQHRPPGWENG